MLHSMLYCSIQAIPLLCLPYSLSLSLPPFHLQGTYDSEGCPIVVFTVARHDMKNSDYKASMQLLFYTLDQLAET